MNDDVKLYLRHDVDFSPKKAVEMAEREHKMSIGPACYYFMVSSDFYNIADKENRRIVSQILDMGHSIGLHYDLSVLPVDDQERSMRILGEVQLLETMFDIKINSIVAHKPSSGFIPSDILIEVLSLVGLNDPHVRLQNYKYISDSGMNFREDPFDALKFHKLIHLNIHPEWWDNKEGTYQDRIFDLGLDDILKQKVYNEINALKKYRASFKQTNHT
jgi:hypothetical protein